MTRTTYRRKGFFGHAISNFSSKGCATMLTAIAAILTAIAALVSAFSRVGSMARYLGVLTITLSFSISLLATSIVLENHYTNPPLLQKYGGWVASVLATHLPQRLLTSPSTPSRSNFIIHNRS